MERDKVAGGTRKGGKTPTTAERRQGGKTRVEVWFDEKQLGQLDALCHPEAPSRSEVIRSLVAKASIR